MKEEITKKIVEEWYGHWISIPVVWCVSILFYVYLMNLFAVSENKILYSIICIASLVLLNLIYDMIVFNNYYIIAAQKNKLGIMIYIDAEDMKTYKEIKRKFGDEFEKSMYDEFVVVYVPFLRKIKNGKQKKLLWKKHCVLMLNITLNAGTKDNTILYDMQINTMILHRCYKENVKHYFESELNKQLQPVSNMEFGADDMVKKLRIRALKISFICNYAVGISFYLSGYFLLAEDILQKLNNELKKTQVVNASLMKQTEELLYSISICKALVYSEIFRFNPENIELVERMKECLEKANLYIRNTTTYYINRAYCDVVLGDVVNASKLINLCKQISKHDLSWKYSEAFLGAYENKSLTKIITLYKNALRVPYDLQDIIIYIETILSREERVGLYLAVAILYEELGNVVLAKENYEKYILEQEDKEKTKEILKKKGYYNLSL